MSSIIYLPIRAACHEVPQATSRTRSRLARAGAPDRDRAPHHPSLEATRPRKVSSDSPRLLEDFLQHEMLIAPLLGHDGIPRHMSNVLRHDPSIETGDAHPFTRQRRHLAIVQEDDLPRVIGQHRRYIRGEEISPLAETYHKWATGARPDDGIGVVRTQNSDGIGPHHLRRAICTAAVRLPVKYLAIRCTITSVSVSVRKSCPSALSFSFRAR